MKRLPLVLLLLAAFALGAAVATKLQTYPYVPDALNEPCGKSVFEWQVMANRIDTTPVPLRFSPDFTIIGLEGEPKPQGLIVRAYLRPRDSQLALPRPGAWQQYVSTLMGGVKDATLKRFGVNTDAAYLMVYIENRLVAINHAGRQIVLKPDATRAEQLAAMAQVLAPPAATRP